MATESIDQISFIIKCIGIGIAIVVPIMGYLLNRSISTIDSDISEIKNRIYGSIDSPGILSRVVKLEEHLPIIEKDLVELGNKVDVLQIQMTNNQEKLTKTINDNAEKTTNKLTKIEHNLGKIVGFLSNKYN